MSSSDRTDQVTPSSHDQTAQWFAEALDMDEERRALFLEQVAAQNEKAARELAALLSAYVRFDEGMDCRNFDRALDDVPEKRSFPSIPGKQTDVPPELLHASPGEKEPLSGRRIGRYQIIRELGRGGTARVYLAYQETPSRLVALKIIPGLGSPESFLDRFRREYQALALMGHPQIATVYDAGRTREGEAWIAVEYVEGHQITEYCEARRLPFRERLHLFMQVLNGVLHAHQRGVVHRDLKPSNILVTEIDGKALVKIIDFGLAKGIHRSLASAMLETGKSIIMGTPAYLSPERMVMGVHHPPDTRADIYALGVILFELLTGRLPFDLSRFVNKPLDEVFRILREENPVPPGKYIRDHEGTFRLPPDLDRIVMKAMAKDIHQRYPSVATFKEDLIRFFKHQPVYAARHGPIQVLQKLAGRNKIRIGATVLILISLVSGITLSLKNKKEAEIARTKYQTVNRFLQNILVAPISDGRGREVRIVDVLQNGEQLFKKGFHGDAELELELRTTLGNTYSGLGLYEEARPHLERALALNRSLQGEDDPRTANAHYRIGRLLIELEQFGTATSHFEAAIATQTRVFGEEHRHTLRSIAGLAETFIFRDRHAEAEHLFRKIWRQQLRLFGPEDEDTLSSLVGLADSIRQDKPVEAQGYYHEALAALKRILGSQHHKTLNTLHNLGLCLIGLRRYQEAEILLRQTVAGCEAALGEMAGYEIQDQPGSLSLSSRAS